MDYLQEAIDRYRAETYEYHPGTDRSVAQRWNQAALQWLLARLGPQEQIRYYQAVQQIRRERLGGSDHVRQR